MKNYVRLSLLVILISVLSLLLFSCGSSETKVNFMVDGKLYFSSEVSRGSEIKMPSDPQKDEHSFDGWFVDSDKWTIPFDKDYFKEANYSSDIFVYAKWTYVHNHVAGEWITEKESSCSEEGLKIKKCIHCNETVESDVIDKKSHSIVTVPGFSETDTTDGLSDGSYCSVCNTIIEGQKIIPARIQGANLKSDLFELDGLNLTAILSNSTDRVSIIENVKINKKASLTISHDELGLLPVNENFVELSEGDNKFFITVYCENETKIYTLNIRRRPNFILIFDTHGGSEVADITVEEGSIIAAPETNRIGYSFAGWSYDFSLPITESKTVSATWTPNDNTAYTVEYYVSSDDGGYTLYTRKVYTGTTDTETKAEIITIDGYKHIETLGKISGIIIPDGSLVLKLYYNATQAHTHSLDGWFTEKAPTCTEEGLRVQRCIYCQEIIVSEAIEKESHTPKILVGFPETDTTDGLSDGECCSVCDTILIEQKVISAHIQGANLKSDLFEINESNLSITLPKSTDEISIEENIKINSKASLIISYDALCEEEVIEKTVKLTPGDNIFYLTVIGEDETKLYRLNIRRRPNFTLIFDTHGGSEVADITVEEGSIIAAPETNRIGYSFAGWSYDFSLPITESKTVSAIWTPNDDTAYTVEYYISSDDGGYTLYDRKAYTGTTDSKVTAEIIEIENYVCDKSIGNLSGNILPDGSLILKIYYKAGVFTVSFDTNCNVKIDDVVIKANTTLDEPDKINSGNNIFLGWYLDGKLWNFENDTVTDNIILTAKWKYQIVFIIDGEEIIDYVEDGALLTEPDVQEKYKHQFMGWYLLGTNVVWSFDTPITESITLEAVWKPVLPADPF